MNLTSKRMMMAAACAGLCAFASMTFAGDPTKWWVSDSFEVADGGAADLPISQYKQTVTEIVGGGGATTTNFLWVADGLDASKIIATNSYIGQPFITNSGLRELVLELATEGSTLTRHVIGDDGSSTGKAFSASAPVYVDTMIQFRPSEDTPTIGDDVKIAVYVNVNSNLVVYHGMDGAYPTNSVFETEFINPDTWYRLTIEMTGYDEWTPACKVYLNKIQLSHANALEGGFFLTAGPGGTLNAVAFQGTGLVDDLAVADDSDVVSPAAVMLTVNIVGSGSVLTNGAAVANGGEVQSGTAIAPTPDDWHRLHGVTGTEASYDGDTGIVTANPNANDPSVTVTFTNVTGTLAMGGKDVSAEKLAAWATQKNTPALTEAQVSANGAAWYDEYLLNIAKNDLASTIEITSISVDAAEATIELAASSTAVDFTASALNGTLNVYTTDDLGTAFTLAGSFTVTPGENGTATVKVPVAQGNFIKAVVE